MINLSPQREKFCVEFISCGNAKTNARTTGKISAALGVDAQQILKKESDFNA